MTHSNIGSSDADLPHTVFRRPRAQAPFPFREIEYARLLILRGRFQDGAFGQDDLAAVPAWPGPGPLTES
jgi:hypothetical protein